MDLTHERESALIELIRAGTNLNRGAAQLLLWDILDEIEQVQGEMP